MDVEPADQKRVIGLGGATIIGLGAIVGGGILALAGVAFGATGPSTLIAFLLNGGIAFLTAIAYAEMSSAFPENGGSYAFTRKVLSVQAAFGVGWIMLFASIAAGVLYALGFAAYAITAAAEIWRLTGGEPPHWLHGRVPLVATAAAAILFYAAVLTRSKGGSGKAETIGKLVVFAVIIVGGLVVLAQEPERASAAKFTPFLSGGLTGLAAAMGYTFIALQGFDIIAAVAGEVRDPKRTLPRAMFLSLAVALVVYMPLLFVIITAGVPEGGNVAELGRSNPETMVADAVGNFLGPTGFWLVMVAALLSMLSALFANVLAASRIAFAMAVDRTLPRSLASVSPTTGIPTRAVLAGAAVMLAMLFAVPDVGSAGAAASLIFLVAFALTHVTNIMARRRAPSAFTGFRAPWFPVLQTIGAVACGGLAVFQALAVPAAGSIAAVWLLGGFGLYFALLAGRANVVDARSEALDPQLVRLRGRNPLVLVPVANPRSATSMMTTARALAAPVVGRVLLLSVMPLRDGWTSDDAPPELTASQDVLRVAFTEAARIGSRPSALMTIAGDPWDEIVRIADTRRCETLLLGLSDFDAAVEQLPIERVIAAVDSDVVILGATPEWDVSTASRILVPVAGEGGNDALRARLLSGLCREAPRRIVFVRIVPTATPEREIKRMETVLQQDAEEEAPGYSEARVIRADDFLEALVTESKESDLVVVGTTRVGGQRAIGRVALAVARAAPGGVLLISHRAG